jgi:hypothetical protein
MELIIKYLLKVAWFVLSGILVSVVFVAGVGFIFCIPIIYSIDL